MVGHTGEGLGTGRGGAWAKGLPRDGAEAAECPDLKLLHWNRHGHEVTSESCLMDTEGKRKR